MIALTPRGLWHGPNPFAEAPVVLVEIAPGAEEDPARLRDAIAVLQRRTGRWFRSPWPDMPEASSPGLAPFLAEWAFQALIVVRGHLRARGAVAGPGAGRDLVWLGFHDPRVSFAALFLAARWLAEIARGATDLGGLDADLDRFWTACRQHHPDYQAAIIMEAADRRGVPYASAWGQGRYWRFGQGARSRVLFESGSCADGGFGARIAASKSATKIVLRSLGLPTPAWRLVTQEQDLDAAAGAAGFPCVVKPIDRSGGKGVSAGLQTMDDLRQGFMTARRFSVAPILVEAHVPGEDHRLIVVDGRFVAAIRREPPSVIGDGVHAIRDLVAFKNRDRDKRSPQQSRFMRPIVLDASARLHLKTQGFDPGVVLPAGRKVRLRSNANLSTGGDCTDVTAHVHPAIRTMIETLAQTLNLQMFGADYLTTDIARAPQDGGGQIIEINTTPGLDALVVAGWPVARAGDLALGPTPGRIPIDLVIVADAMLASTVDATRHAHRSAAEGWATADAAGIGAAILAVETKGPWSGVDTLLAHRAVSAAVIVAGLAQVMRHGLPVAHCATAHIGCALPVAWRRVLARHCGVVQVAEPQGPEVAGAAPG